MKFDVKIKYKGLSIKNKETFVIYSKCKGKAKTFEINIEFYIKKCFSLLNKIIYSSILYFIKPITKKSLSFLY